MVELDTISASDADGSGSSPDGYTISAHAKGAYKTPTRVSFSMQNRGIISPYFIWLCFTLRSFFKFSKTKGLFVAMIPSVGHSSICPQSAQVSDSFSLTQLCTGQNLSQKGVFAPAIRHPVQFIISGVIVHPVEFCPQRGSLFTQSVIVCNRCYPRIALFAIQSATADKLICVFHSYLCKLKNLSLP